MESKSADNNKPVAPNKETRHIVIYGYTREELGNIMRHFEAQLPEYVKITIDSRNLVTKVTFIPGWSSYVSK